MGEVEADAKKATMLGGYSVAEFPTNVYEICALIHPDDYEAPCRPCATTSAATPTYMKSPIASAPGRLSVYADRRYRHTRRARKPYARGWQAS